MNKANVIAPYEILMLEGKSQRLLEKMGRTLRARPLENKGSLRHMKSSCWKEDRRVSSNIILTHVYTELLYMKERA